MNTKRKTRNTKLPFVLVNMAISADGKIASANRVVTSLGTHRDQTHMYELRATTDVVLCGARTVDLNEISLSPGAERFRKLRLKRGLAEHNLRVVVTGSGSLDPNAHIFKKRFSPIIILTTARADARKLKALRTVADEVKIVGEKELNFRAALAWLRKKWNVKRLICEGGGELNDALFRAGVVDELHLTLTPFLIGGRHAPTICDGVGFPKLARAAQLRLKSSKRVGDELFLVYSVRRAA